MFSFESAVPYVTTTQFIVALPSFILVYGIYKILAFAYDELTSPYRDIPGPPNPSFLYGNFKQLSESNDSSLEEAWINQYGSTVKFKMLLGSTVVMTTDLKAVHHILANNYDFIKVKLLRRISRTIFGIGILNVEGDEHKKHRRILNPAFGPQQIREVTGIFVEKAIELRDIWSKEIVKHDGVAPIESLSWMSRATLDIIGLAGFNYNFNALTTDPEKNELQKAISSVFKAGQKPSLLPTIKAMYPILHLLPPAAPNEPEREKASAIMNRIGTELLEQTKDKTSQRKDLLSVLARVNMHQMNKEEVMSQISTFITAGHETTSVTMAWAIYALGKDKAIQTKLREEISRVPTDYPTMDDLNGLPYLDAVVRETLRLYSAVASTQRCARKDDCIPLSKPFTDKKGIVRNEIRLRKGQIVMIPAAVIHRDKSVWGEDAAEFKPERWANIPNAASLVPGVWSNILTFLGGPRACMGYRFSIVETKALVFTLIRAFEIDLAISPKDIGLVPMGLRRPVLLKDPNYSNQMPIFIRPAPTNI